MYTRIGAVVFLDVAFHGNENQNESSSEKLSPGGGAHDSSSRQVD